MTQCPNCFQGLNSDSTDTHNALQRRPDQKLPEMPRVDRNIPLAASVLFDAKTKRFIVSEVEHPEEGFMKSRRTRKRFFPDLKDLPRTKNELPGKEFKQIAKPGCGNMKKNVDDVNKSCTDLAIDG